LSYVTVKRAFDATVAALAIVVLSPLLAGVAAAVRVDSPGPILFRQVRVGLDGSLFTIWKFRSMIDGADRIADNVSPTGDPRVTRVGRVLREWYLDELPQLFNVLRGDMSLVGPRPETPEFVARYRPDELQVLSIRPGLVGPSTLTSMDEAEILAGADDPLDHYITTVMPERVRLDLTYLERVSLVYDVKLLVSQASAIFRDGIHDR
jgi:lipopolysaccharide/colanic/teichoic acid biosynthesis glycosyltransferase